MFNSNLYLWFNMFNTSLTLLHVHKDRTVQTVYGAQPQSASVKLWITYDFMN